MNVADNEIAVVGVLETEQFRRKAGDIAVASDIQHAEGRDLFIADCELLRAQDTGQHLVDLSNEDHLVSPTRLTPKSFEKIGEPSPKIHFSKELGLVIPFRLLHVEADVVDALHNVEIDQCVWIAEAILGKHGNHVEADPTIS